MIHSTFGGIRSPPNHFPNHLVADLLSHFSSSKGYELFSDVRPFFNEIRMWKARTEKLGSSPLTVGIITNSDNRVPNILSSFGLKIGSLGHNEIDRAKGGSRYQDDIDFVVMSYDVGFEKPDGRIFDAARELVSKKTENEIEHNQCLHVGDSIGEDCRGARNVGWQSVLLDRNGEKAGWEAPVMQSLRELKAEILFGKGDLGDGVQGATNQGKSV